VSRALDWKPSARRDLKRLAPEIRTRVVEAMKHHAATGQGTVRKLTDVSPPEYRLRVGDWRIRFAVDPDDRQKLVVLRVLPRDKAYR
jgi:mRNA-degrading endonuclease RelE of RelBE toxin-antitoxin system